MASKIIEIQEDVYNLLLELRKKGEDISDVIKRLASKENINGSRLKEFFGAWNIGDDEFEKIHKEIQSVSKNTSLLISDEVITKIQENKINSGYHFL